MKTKIRNTIALLIFFLFFHTLKAQERSIETSRDTVDWKDESAYNFISGKLISLENLPEFTTTEEDIKEWWRLFGYERLNNLIALALEENHTVKMAQSQVGISEEEIKLAKASRLPAVSLNPSFNRQGFSGNRPMPFDGPVEKITYNTYALPMDVAYEVDVFGRMKNEIEASQYLFEASTASHEASRLQVASEVARYFLLLLMLDSEEEILKKARKSREENLGIVNARFEAGLTNEIDLHRAQTELSSVVVQINELEIRRRDNELALATIVGQPSQSFVIEKTGLKYAVPSMAVNSDKNASYSPNPGLTWKPLVIQ